MCSTNKPDSDQDQECLDNTNLVRDIYTALGGEFQPMSKWLLASQHIVFVEIYAKCYIMYILSKQAFPPGQIPSGNDVTCRERIFAGVLNKLIRRSSATVVYSVHNGPSSQPICPNPVRHLLRRRLLLVHITKPNEFVLPNKSIHQLIWIDLSSSLLLLQPAYLSTAYLHVSSSEGNLYGHHSRAPSTLSSTYDLHAQSTGSGRDQYSSSNFGDTCGGGRVGIFPEEKLMHNQVVPAAINAFFYLE